MASSTATQATTSSKAAKGGTESGIGVTQLAESLGTEPHTLRAFIRTLDLGVGRGSRYRWASMSNPQVKQIVAAWESDNAK